MIQSLPLATILLLACLQLHGQSMSTLSGARAQGLGYASSCLFNEWAILNNTGGIAKVEKPVAALTYSLNSFLPNGNSQAIAVCIPFKSLVSGMAAHLFGDQLYREQVISAGVANTFGLASLGIKLNYIQYRIQGFGQKGFLTVSVGGIANITPEFSVGAHIININQPRISDQEDERIPTTLLVGLLYDISNKMKLMAELEKDLEYNPVFKMGFEYTPQKKITIRTGFNLNPSKVFFGVGFSHKQIRIDYAIEYRMEMGVSNQASLSYQFLKK